jgi:hypothetical protein
MPSRKLAALVVILLTTQFALADASYQSTSQITGGQFIDFLRGQAFIGKQIDQMLAPTNRLILVHGNQKAEVSKERTEIIDLDKGEIIRIDHVKKTYTIVTFEQMRKMMATMPERMKEMQAAQKQPQMPQTDLQFTFETSVNNTGVTKVVNGLTAQEQIVTLKMITTVPNAPAGQPGTIAYTVTTDAWIAPDPPEIKEIQDFDRRMGEKMMAGVDLQAFAASMKANGNAGMAQMFGGHPGSSEALAQMSREMAKIKGTRVLEVTSMGGDAPAQPAGTAAAPAPAPAQPQGSVAGQVATDTATQTASSESSRLGAFGSALSNSALGAFHRKKATPPPPPPPPAPAAGATGATGTTKVTLMETTAQETNFSQEPVPLSVFQIPAGYKQVQSPMAQ